MQYPEIEEVESADRLQLAMWYRFLPSPATGFIGKPNFNEMLQKQKEILDRIIERFGNLGGMTPEISKSIGF